MSHMVFFLIAAASGATMALQGTFNSALGKTIGVTQATLVVHGMGTIVAALVLFAPGFGKEGFSRLTQAPWYAYLGGALSVAIVYGVAVSIPKLSVSNATTAIIVGQVTTALIIDSFGWFGVEKLDMTWLRAVGLVLLAAGAKLLLVKV